MWVVLLDPAHTLDHAVAVAMRGINHDGVNTGFDQGFNTFFSALAHADCCAYAQAAMRITRSVGEAGLLGDVLHRDDAFELKSRVDHQQTLQFEFIQQCFGLRGRCALRFLHGHQFLARGHNFTDRYVITVFKTQIAAGDDTDDFAAITDRKARNTQLIRQIKHLAHGMRRRDHHGVAQDARFVAFHFRNLRGLLFSG